MAVGSGNAIKICLVGNSRVGKSCIAERLVHDIFHEKTQSTMIGRAFLHKALTVEGETVKVNIWDTAGEEKFHSLAPMYYRYASAMVLVYDITDTESFLNLRKFWVPSIKSCNDPSIPLAIVGNKLDLEETDRAISTEEGQGYADILEAVFLETSAKTAHNVERIFTELILKIRDSQRRRQMNQAEEMEPRNVIVPHSTPAKENPLSCICH
ncbi:ras-related protein RHN1-like [Patiria miniata]|uniref:Uncharacterized protein n=1 Tax=Patiria miniata TaxID=46514 RepID=A0A914B2A5_PATMI|nr:ras-related protein RHN1-like [Patiria miniata]